MNTLIHADIFFFVTTIAVIIVTLLLIVVFIYLIRVLRQVEEIGKEIKSEAVLIREDIKDLRGSVRREGFKIQSFMDFFKKLFIRKKSSRSKNN
jgi:hypothetical protein